MTLIFIILPKSTDSLLFHTNASQFKISPNLKDSEKSPTKVSLSRTRKVPSPSAAYCFSNSSASLRPPGRRPWNHFSPKCSSSCRVSYNKYNQNNPKTLDTLLTLKSEKKINKTYFLSLCYTSCLLLGHSACQ